MVNVNLIENHKDNIDLAYDEMKRKMLAPEFFLNSEISAKYNISKQRIVRLKKKICDELGVTSDSRFLKAWNSKRVWDNKKTE